MCRDLGFLSTTLGIAIYLHSPQTKVCPLCARAVLGTIIGIAVHCMSRPSFLPGMTLGIIVCLHSPKTGVCPLCTGTWVSLARPSVLSSVFTTLISEFVCCVLRYPLGYNLWRCLPLHTKNLLCTQHDSQHYRLSSQSSDHGLSAVYWDLFCFA